MVAFEIKDMTCGHCARTITEAVQALDSGAEVHIDLATHRVDITPSQADAAALSAAIEAAGYTPIDIATAGQPALAVGAPERGGCCGGKQGCCG